jgi:hypothetical protein
VIAAAEFGSALRHFQRRSEKIAHRSGLTPQRYFLLMMINGGDERASEASRLRAASTALKPIRSASSR